MGHVIFEVISNLSIKNIFFLYLQWLDRTWENYRSFESA